MNKSTDVATSIYQFSTMYGWKYGSNTPGTIVLRREAFMQPGAKITVTADLETNKVTDYAVQIDHGAPFGPVRFMVEYLDWLNED